jgi:hypothetical protein
MSLKTFFYDKYQAKDYSCPFRGEFLMDPWIVFHGTGGRFSEGVEHDGLSWNDNFYTKKTVNEVVQIYDHLQWYGIHSDGLAVLKSYTTMDFDRGTKDSTKPVFFHSISQDSLLYTTPIRAGGETAQALRLAIQDLRSLATDPNEQQKMKNDSWASMNRLVNLAFPGCGLSRDKDRITYDDLIEIWEKYSDLFQANNISIPRILNVKQLVGQISSLETKLHDVIEMPKQHNQGVIYAVRFSSDDLPKLESFGGSGIGYFGVVPPEKIIAKAIIPVDCFERGFSIHGAKTASSEVRFGRFKSDKPGLHDIIDELKFDE